MTIEVKNRSASAVMDEDGLFRCGHDHAVIDLPCCDGAPDEAGRLTCGCQGRFSISCPDCESKELTESQVEELLGY